MTRRIWHKAPPSKARADRGRPRIVMVPTGTSTMSNEEFWGIVRANGPTIETIIPVRGSKAGQSEYIMPFKGSRAGL